MPSLLSRLALIILTAPAFAQNPAPPAKKNPFEGFGTALDKRPGGAQQASGSQGGTALDQGAQAVLPGPAINGVQLVKATYGIPGGRRTSVAPAVYKQLQKGNVSPTNKVRIFASNELQYTKQPEAQRFTSTVRRAGPNAAIVDTTAEGRPTLTITYRANGAEKTVTAAQGESISIPE